MEVFKGSFGEAIANVNYLYGTRNAMYLRGEYRSLFLDDAVKKFAKAIRNHEENAEVLSNLLASVLARLLSFADSFIDLPLVESLSRKYGGPACGYCNRYPCRCGTDRKGSLIASAVTEKNLKRSIKDWIRAIDETYGKQNRENGIWFALLRLQEEITEAKNAHLFDNASDTSITLQQRREMLSDEFADAIAWIFSIAGMLHLSLGAAFCRRYYYNCGRCNKRPCNCPSPILMKRRANPAEGGTSKPETILAGPGLWGDGD